MHDLGECAADGAPRADAEQAFRGGVDVRDDQPVIEDDERGRKALQNLVGIRRPAGAPSVSGAVSGACRLTPLAG
jgi:hypothetical protein